MTDDTLREECEQWILRHAPPRFNNTEFAWRVRALEAFARAQQAKGLREASELCKTKGKLHDMDWWRDAPKTEVSKVTALDLAEIIEAQATAREQAPVPYPGWCRQPAQCQGKVSCPLDPTCAD